MVPRVELEGQRGFTLIEVLIAVLVLAVGLLGLAGLQLAGMKSNHSAYLRSQATIAAYDLLDRMRADPGAFRGGPYVIDPATDSGSSQFEAWERLVASLGLPAPADGGGQGVADCTADNGCGSGNCEVVVRWNDSRGERAAAGAAQRAEDLTFRVCSRLPARS
jgi:type IV pilus assembly protein PilV